MKQREFSDDTVQLATRIPKALHIRVRLDAIDKHQTVAEWVGEALVDHLAECQGKKRPAAKAAAGAG